LSAPTFTGSVSCIARVNQEFTPNKSLRVTWSYLQIGRGMGRIKSGGSEVWAYGGSRNFRQENYCGFDAMLATTDVNSLAHRALTVERSRSRTALVNSGY